jgi:hypothetical protein
MSGGVVAYQRALAHAVGDAVAGLLFSQLWYWSGKQPDDRDGWFYMTQAQIFEETAITRREQETSRRKLRYLGILEEALRGHPAQLWYRINVRAVVDLLEKSGAGRRGGIRQTSVTESAGPVRRKAPNWNGGKRQTPSKNSAKSPAKNSAAPPPAAEAAGEEAAVRLTEELVAHGVGRAAAQRLALEKPDVCRRCLEYLPFARFRTTQGAWLANAIRDEYGPPEGYLRAKERENRDAAIRDAAAARSRRKSRQDALRREKAARLAETLSRMENERGNALAAFTQYVDQERVRVEKIAAHLSPERRREQLAVLASRERRLELLDQWLTARGVGNGSSGENAA